MLDFGKHRRPRNYLGRREQWRLLALVAALGLVALLIGRAARPDSWNWMWGGRTSPVAEIEPSPATPVDTRLAVVAPSSSEPDAVVVAPPEPDGPAPGRRLLPGVDLALLDTVRDDQVFRSAEHEAFYSLLALLERTDGATLARHSTGPVSYVQLFRQPAQYRGEVVDLRGTVRQAQRVEAQPNEKAVASYWRLALQPDDHRDGLIFIYCLGLPPGFPTDASARPQVDVRGIAFKRWAYQAQDAPRTAPLVLAKTVVWLNPPQATRASAGRTSTALIALGIAAAAAVAFSVLFLARGPRRPMQRVATAAAPDAPIAAMRDFAGPSPVEALQSLTEQAEPAPRANGSSGSSP